MVTKMKNRIRTMYEGDMERADFARPKPVTLADISEADHQASVIRWRNAMAWKYPALRWLHHCPNGGFRNGREAVKLKHMGVTPGIPDLFLPYPRNGAAGLYIEMKSETGRATACQVECIRYLRSVGYKAYVCHGADEAIKRIQEYLEEVET